MSVAEQLGLHDPNSEVLRLARSRWVTWCAEHPGLGGAPPPASLRGWLRTSRPATTDAVMAALAHRGHREGGDDVTAAAVVCWVLLPGAATLAARLQPLSSDIDALVASQLWLEVRSGRPPVRGVAASLLMDTRKGVLCQLGVGRPVGSRFDRATLVDPTSRPWADLPNPDGHRSAAAELNDLLERASRDGVLSPQDCRLLLRLTHASDISGPRCASRGGLTAAAVTTVVCAELGVSARTVRRRAQYALTALARAYAVERVSA